MLAVDEMLTVIQGGLTYLIIYENDTQLLVKIFWSGRLRHIIVKEKVNTPALKHSTPKHETVKKESKKPNKNTNICD